MPLLFCCEKGAAGENGCIRADRTGDRLTITVFYVYTKNIDLIHKMLYNL